MSRVDYGIDAPGLVRFFVLAGLVAALLTVLIPWLVPFWRLPLAALSSLADIEHRAAYTQTLRAVGFKDIQVVVNPVTDKILRTISGGSFGPATHYATK
jgi:hypothetical protein